VLSSIEVGRFFSCSFFEFPGFFGGLSFYLGEFLGAMMGGQVSFFGGAVVLRGLFLKFLRSVAFSFPLSLPLSDLPRWQRCRFAMRSGSSLDLNSVSFVDPSDCPKGFRLSFAAAFFPRLGCIDIFLLL